MTHAATRIVCFGDSITHGAEFSEEQRWTSLLQAHLDDWRPGLYEVHNRGIDSNTSAQGIDRFTTDVLPLLPALLLVEFGFNDANVRDWAQVPRLGVQEYAKNMREFHRVALDRGGQCVFIVNHSIGHVDGRQGNGRSYNANFAPYNEALRALAAEIAAPAIDLPLLMKRAGIRPQEFLAADGLHLSVAGNRYYAELVFASLKAMLAGQDLPVAV